MIGRNLSISAVFIVTLIFSSPASSSRILPISPQQTQDFLYSIKVSPTFVNVQQGKFANFEVQVLRGSETGGFSVDLSLIANSAPFKAAASFIPAQLNFEQGQSTKNATLRINSFGLDPGFLRFRVTAATQTPTGHDMAQSSTAALIIKPSETSATQSREALSSGSSSSSATTPSTNTNSLSAVTEENQPALTNRANHPPVARAGPDQTVKEGDVVTLDGSFSTDPDKDSLSYSWVQFVSPRQPNVKLEDSGFPNKVGFVAPDVAKDTILTFKLVVKDNKGGQATDSINVLVRNVAVTGSPSPNGPETLPKDQGAQSQKQSTSQETVPSPGLDSGSEATSVPPTPKVENHAPAAEVLQIVSTVQDKPISIFLKGNDPDKDDRIFYLLVTNPSHGTIAGFDKALGSFIYMPNSGYRGQDRLSFKVVDSHGAGSNDGLVALRVSALDTSSSPILPSSPKANGNATESITTIINGAPTGAGSNAKNNNNNANNSTNKTGANGTANTTQTRSNANATSVPGQISTHGINASAAAKGKNQTAGNQTAGNQTAGNQTAGNLTSGENKTLASFATSALATGEQYFFHLKWGGPGTLKGNFSSPHDIAIDLQKNVFVLDSGNNRIQKFDKTGNFIATSFPTTFNNPQGITVDNTPGPGNGDVYVVDTGNNLVKRFTNTGVLVKSWAGPSGSGPFNTPIDAAIDSGHNVYISDSNNHRIVKTDNNGGFLVKFGTTGNAKGQVKGPHAIAIGSGDFIYVVDTVNKAVIKYTSAGTWTGVTITGGGSGIGSFVEPHGIAIDSSDKLFVTDRGGNKVWKFDNAGGFLANFGNPLPDPTTNFNAPDGIATSSDSILQVYVVDVGNNRVEVFSNVPPASITMTLDNTSPKWGQNVTASGSVTSALPDDKISINWGDGTALTQINPVPPNGEFTATHIYDASAIATNPHNVVGRLLTSQGVERARTPVNDLGLLVTVQKHATQLTVALSHDSPVCANCALTLSGILTDMDSTPPNAGIAGKTIAFTGSGVPSPVSSVQTQGVTFSGDSNNNVTLSKPNLLMHVGSHISLPPSSYGAVFRFDNTVDLRLTKSDNTIITVTAGAGADQQAEVSPNSIKDIAIMAADGSSSNSAVAKLSYIATRNIEVTPNPMQFEVDFSKDVGQPEGSYPTLVIDPGSYFATGVTENTDVANGLKITAGFDAASDPAYLGATTQELSYDIDSSESGVGEGAPVSNIAGDAIWTKLSVGTGGIDDVCKQNGSTASGGDTDSDGICDIWEKTGTGSISGNDATHRYVVCPSNAGFAYLDLQCKDPNFPGHTPAIKHDLCINDFYASVWGNKVDGTSSTPTTICPTAGHKDMFVEIDYMSSHQPSTNAIKNVIKAYGNAPFTGQTADAFGRTTGITLHVVKSDSLSEVAPFYVWRDPPTSGDTNANNDFYNVKLAKFGTSAERAGTALKHCDTNGANCVAGTATDWQNSNTGINVGKTLKHYVTHYGMSINWWATASGPTSCPSAGLPSGLAETLGNDFVISLGCGFAAFGTAASDDQQAGTIMHELGHNLNLNHGGVGAGSTIVCKPNRFSVMDYGRQMPNSVYTASVWESRTVSTDPLSFNYGATGTQTALDYARTTAPNQLETAVNEVAGTAAANGRSYKVLYSDKNGAVKLDNSKANFDFSGEGSLTTNLPWDINNVGSVIGGCGPSTGQTLNNNDDWGSINLVFLSDAGGDSQDGLTGSESKPKTSPNGKEMAPPFLDAVHDKAADLIEFIPPPSTDGSSVSNAGSTIPMKFRLRDVDGNFVRDAAVTFVAKKASAPFTVFTGPIPSFVYDLPSEKYQYNWVSGQAKGVWQIFYYQNYGTPNQVLLQGPEAKAAGASYTFTLTLK